MPELLAFVGPCTVVPFVVPKSQVSFLTVCWEPGHDRPEEIVKCIAESRTDVVGMDNLVVGWNPELLGMIATHLPKMERLRIRNAYAFPKELMEVCVCSIRLFMVPSLTRSRFSAEIYAFYGRRVAEV